MREGTSKLESGRSQGAHQLDEQRERILDAAEKLFLQSGIEATRMLDIAAEAGITKVTLYRYFPNRDTIAVAIQARMLARLNAVVRPPHQAATPAAVREVVRALIRNFTALREVYRYMGMFDARFLGLPPEAALPHWAKDRPTIYLWWTQLWHQITSAPPELEHYAVVLSTAVWFLEKLALRGELTWSDAHVPLEEHLRLFENVILGYLSMSSSSAITEATMHMESLGSPLIVRTLRSEYLEDPLGIDARQPGLSWQIAGPGRGLMQSAYQIQAAADAQHLAEGAELLWDSGKVSSDRTQGIRYAGSALASRQRVVWRVRAWDQADRSSPWSEPAWWEMGLLEEQDWAADWIEVGWDEDVKATKPCPYFRRNFALDQPILSARLYITAHGLYEAWINGQRVGDQLFTPGYTPYDKMLQYQVYDVTRLLQPGENVLGAILGDGWYRGKIYITQERNVYGARLGLLARLEITTAEGVVVIATDPNWRVSTGPILLSDMRDGEIYDARLEMRGWSAPGFDDRTWRAVRVAPHPKHALVASMGVPVRRKERFHPRILKTPKGESVLDFGQNLAGVVRFRVRGPAGTTVRLRHGEALDKHGNFTMANLFVFKPRVYPFFQEIAYTLKGEGEEEYEPHFTVHGFRYVLLEGYPGEPRPEDFSSIAIYSDMPPTGTFECSDPLINQLHHNTEWSMKSNFLDLPTDCPQRERAGWTGDVQIFAPSASFLMDTRAFFRKWLTELRHEQRPGGRLGNFVPDPYRLKPIRRPELSASSAGWGDAAVRVPWALYEAYGDPAILEAQYESMKAWVENVRSRARKMNWMRYFDPRLALSRAYRERQRLIWETGYHWGEWLEPGSGSNLAIALGMGQRLLFGSGQVATAYYSSSARLLARTAELLGKPQDATAYHALADAVKAAYQAQYIRGDGSIKPDRQASYVRALAFDLAPEGQKPAIVEHLVRLVRAAGNHIGTGFLSTPYLCHVLAEHGRLDVAYELLNQTTIPSWLYAVTRDATTVWETWEGIKEDGSPWMSLNHYSPGSVINFLHRKVAGIAPAEPGYKRIAIHPMPGGGLTRARASFESVHGLIVSEWEIQSGTLRLSVTIPANTHAQVALPGARLDQVMESGGPVLQAEGATEAMQTGPDCELELGSGSYVFTYPTH